MIKNDQEAKTIGKKSFLYNLYTFKIKRMSTRFSVLWLCVIFGEERSHTLTDSVTADAAAAARDDDTDDHQETEYPNTQSQ